MDLEEALAQAETYSSENEVLVIDNNLRTIAIPSSITIAGVESDEDVRRLNFQMPAQYGEVDLSEFNVRINYLNANLEGDLYKVTDAVSADGLITFSWLLGRKALAYRGALSFSVCLKKKDSEGNVIREFNVTPAQLNVLEGLETTEQIVQENPDIIEQMLDMLKTIEEGAVDVDAEMREYMNIAKPAIAKAIISKGGIVESTDSLNDYATRISEIPNGIGAAETLPRQTTLVATGLQDTTGILLSWTDVDAAGYLIVRKQDTAPATSADGTIIYNGAYAADGYTDTGVSRGNVYYYRIFPRNTANQYQSLEAGAVAMVDYKDRTGEVLIADLPLGSRIKFGAWNGSEFFWEIVDTLDKNQGFVTVAAEQNLGSRQYDAPETNNTITNRKNQGNNRWAYCAIRQLFNSAEDTGAWWTAQHDYDVAPSYATQIPGFMRDFTDYEKSVVLTKTNRCVLDTNDGGGSETVEDKFWCPSSYAMGLEIFQPLEDDHPYEAYTSNADRAYQSNFWCRTINGTSSASGVRFVNSGGSLNSSAANNSGAARPFCLLPTSAYMLWSDSDEAYTFADDSQQNTG